MPEFGQNVAQIVVNEVAHRINSRMQLEFGWPSMSQSQLSEIREFLATQILLPSADIAIDPKYQKQPALANVMSEVIGQNNVWLRGAPDRPTTLMRIDAVIDGMLAASAGQDPAEALMTPELAEAIRTRGDALVKLVRVNPELTGEAFEWLRGFGENQGQIFRSLMGSRGVDEFNPVPGSFTFGAQSFFSNPDNVTRIIQDQDFAFSPLYAGSQDARRAMAASIGAERLLDDNGELRPALDWVRDLLPGQGWNVSKSALDEDNHQNEAIAAQTAP